jgi:hypothetical protein
MATETLINIGTCRERGALGLRNFEDSGTVGYKSNSNGLWFNGSRYNIGSTLPFDVAGTSYSVKAIALLRFYWDQDYINPLT